MERSTQGTALAVTDTKTAPRRDLLITAAEWQSLIAEDPQADPTWPRAWLRALAPPDSPIEE